MNDISGNRVTRYCPECGRKFNGPESQFEQPRLCPACKTRVFFLEYQKSELPEKVDADPLKPTSFIKKIRAATIGLSVGAAAVVLVAIAAAALTGSFNAFFFLSCFFLVCGIAGIAVFLESTGKLQSLSESLKIRESQLRTAAENQSRHLSLYQGMKKNFDSILDDERSRLQLEWNRLIAEAASNAEATQTLRAAAKTVSEEQSGAIRKMAERMLTEVRKSIKSKLNATNFATSKERFNAAIAFCEKHGYAVPSDMVAAFHNELQRDYEQVVKTQLAKEEQAAIRERMREEAKAERELAKELARIDAEEIAIRSAINEALARAAGEHTAEVDALLARLAEAEARGERAKSMAQMTKAGHVYVISNIGSLGENVFKIGMTRRLEPLDRVRELSDASVPFPFDVHMMISSENAPALETALHREFHHRRVNRVNFRKEFFSVSIEEISSIVHRECGEIDYVIDPEAGEYRESLTLSEEDFAFISSQVDAESLSED